MISKFDNLSLWNFNVRRVFVLHEKLCGRLPHARWIEFTLVIRIIWIWMMNLGDWLNMKFTLNFKLSDDVDFAAVNFTVDRLAHHAVAAVFHREFGPQVNA